MQLIFCQNQFLHDFFTRPELPVYSHLKPDSLGITIVVSQKCFRYNLVLVFGQTFRFRLIADFGYYIFGDYNFVEQESCGMR